MKKIAVLLVVLFAAIDVSAKVFYANGPSDKKAIALTFDDGPGAGTEKVLKILDEKEVKATFFMLGSRVDQYTKRAKMVADAGHEIANHTYAHVNFYSYKNEDKISKMEEELLKAEKAILKATGQKTFLVRFPHGYSKQDAKDIAKKNGYYIINWSAGYDWHKVSSREMLESYLKAVKNGAILLMHDGNSGIRLSEFLGDLIDEIKLQGYEIMPAGELLNLYQNQQKGE